MKPGSPIGVFDSGVGGLTVLREIRSALPGEHLLYVADSQYAPYGEKSRTFIEARAIAICEFLLEQQAKAIVVACNTATAAAITTLRARFAVPIIAIEPAVKPAVQQTKSKVVGVLATSGTLASDNFMKLLLRFGTDVNILVQPCPGLVEQIEVGDLSGAVTRTLLEKYLQPLLAQGMDTIVLGCTHYPFLAPLIRTIAGAGVSIIDSTAAIASELSRRMEGVALSSAAGEGGTERFWTSGTVEKVQPVIAQLWNAPIVVKRMPASQQTRGLQAKAWQNAP